MAYILQHRRDTLENWKSVNPVLADAEIGFILDLDETGKQKSSLYKIGDGATSWNDLPLFGFGGNVYNTFSGNDLDISVASRQAVLDKINEIVSKSTGDLELELTTRIDTLESDVINGSESLEGLVNKLSTTQLVQLVKLAEEEDPETLQNQIVSRAALLTELNEVLTSIAEQAEKHEELKDSYDEFTGTTYTNFVTLTTHQINILNSFKDTFGPWQESVNTTLESHTSSLDEHEKFIKGYDEQTGVGEDEQPIITHHKGVDEKIADVDTKANTIDTKVDALRTELLNRHQVVTEQEFARLDFSQYSEGTLFYTYKVQ